MKEPATIIRDITTGIVMLLTLNWYIRSRFKDLFKKQRNTCIGETLLLQENTTHKRG